MKKNTFKTSTSLCMVKEIKDAYIEATDFLENDKPVRIAKNEVTKNWASDKLYSFISTSERAAGKPKMLIPCRLCTDPYTDMEIEERMADTEERLARLASILDAFPAKLIDRLREDVFFYVQYGKKEYAREVVRKMLKHFQSPEYKSSSDEAKYLQFVFVGVI